MEYILLVFFFVVMVAWGYEIAEEFCREEPCQHTVKFRYYSLNIFQCADCGLKIPMKNNNVKIKHQR